MRIQHAVETEPPDFHGHAPDVTTQRLGRGGNASLGIPGATKLNQRSAAKRTNMARGHGRGKNKKRH